MFTYFCSNKAAIRNVNNESAVSLTFDREIFFLWILGFRRQTF